MGKIKALIDTNVLLDHLAHREGFCQDAAVIFSMIDEVCYDRNRNESQRIP